MKDIFPVILILLVSLQAIMAQPKYQYPIPALYGTGEWDEDSLGNHRVVLYVEDESDIVRAIIPWRRSDHDPEKKGIIMTLSAIGLKFLLFLSMLGIYALFSKNLEWDFIITFFLIYLSFTVYLLITFVRILKLKRSNE